MLELSVPIIRQLVAQAAGWAGEAASLATGAPTVDQLHTATPVSHLIQVLADIRRRMDRLDQLLANVSVVRGQVRRQSVAAKNEADDAWDEAAIRRRQQPVQRGDEFYSAREREAEANLATVGERRTARLAADTVSQIEEHYDTVRLFHRGLDRDRQDVHAMIRALSFESHLERQ